MHHLSRGARSFLAGLLRKMWQCGAGVTEGGNVMLGETGLEDRSGYQEGPFEKQEMAMDQ